MKPITEGATSITMHWGETRTPVISWTTETEPTNVDTVMFVRGDVDRRYSLVRKDDGLYVMNGLVIIVK